MKIVQINAVYKKSSTGRTTMELHYVLRTQEIESYVFAADSPVEEENVFLIGNQGDRKIHALLSRASGLQGYFSHGATRKLISQLEQIEPDVVHLRNLHGNYIHLPMLMDYLQKNKSAVVVTLHDCWFFTGKCCHYTEDSCLRWKESCGHCPALHKWNKSWLFDRSRKMLKDKKNWFTGIHRLAVVGVSDWITNEARQSLLGSASIVRRIYNWIDLDVFKPQDTAALRQKLGLKSEFVVLGVSQVWDEKKGFSVFLDLARQMPDIKVLLVGAVPEGAELPANVLAVGTVNDTATLSQYYSMADVFFNPSIQETFGKVTAEAMACGTPVIGYNATATPELLGEGCGMVVQQGADSTEIVEAVRTIQNGDARCLSEHCREYACRNFDKDKNIEDYIALYKELTEC